MALYEFKREDAERFRQHVGGKAQIKGNEMEFGYCPYCKGGKHKDIGTFTINLTTGQYRCRRATCGASGNMITLARDFDFQLSENVSRYYNQNNYNKKFRKFPKMDNIEVKDEAVQYLLSRGISEETTRKYEVTVRKDHNKTLAFPFKDENGEVKYIKYRKTDFVKGRDKGKEWCEKDGMPILFGMYQCEDPSDEFVSTLVITEGQIDSLSVAECGIKNAVSVPTGCNGWTWLPHCWDWVNKFDNIIVFGDRDGENMTLIDTIAQAFNKLNVCAVNLEDYKGCKDANELLQKYGKKAVANAVMNARPRPIAQLKRGRDIKRIDTENMERLRTGIPEIDKFTRGLYFGAVTILTGPMGDGKSTFGSQIMCKALKDGHKIMTYSGELSQGMFKDWFVRQLAGSRVHTQINHYGDECYSVSRTVEEKIENWLGDNWWHYNDEALVNPTMEGELKELPDVIEDAIKRYGTRVILIDNLMSALDENDAGSLNLSQTNFIKKLTNIAKTYNVLILLVAHQKKLAKGQTADKNDISGASEIGKLASVIMEYSRRYEESDDERFFRVLKNRIDGREHRKDDAIRLYFNASSKRISGANMDFSWTVGWEKAEEQLVVDEDGVIIEGLTIDDDAEPF